MASNKGSFTTLAVVGVVILYFSATIALSIPFEEVDEAFPFQSYDEDALIYNRPSRRNGSRFNNCTAGERNLSSLCESNVTLRGASAKQIVLYQVIVVRGRPNVSAEVDQQRPFPRSIVCCQGVGYNLNGSRYLQPIGCGVGKFGGAAYWGNATGNPGIQCIGIPRARQLKWRYVPIVLGGGSKQDIGGEYYSDMVDSD